jgi:hypothetical protein
MKEWHHTLSLRDFIDSINESSGRGRWIIFSLIVASVLGLVAVANSFEYSWAHQRITRLAADEKYAAFTLGYIKDINSNIPNDKQKDVDKACEHFRNSLTSGYVEHAFGIKVPFFGVEFDVNDLSLFSGIGFITLLILLHYSLRNELVSLKLAKSVIKSDEEDFLYFYDLLAMKQVLTVPNVDIMPPPSWLTRKIPKVVLFLPTIVYLLIYCNDLYSLDIGKNISNNHTLILLAYSTIFLFCIVLFGISCWRKWNENDQVWDDMWKDRKKLIPSNT